MKDKKTYNLFLFLSTFTRNLVQVYSLVLLYKKGYSLNNLLFFLFLTYTVGILVNYLSLKISYKITLIISSLIYSLSFIYLSLMNNSLISLIILSIIFSFGNYSYHAIRHLLALTMINDQNRKTTTIITINYLGIITASLIGMYLLNKLSLQITSIIILILSFISILKIIKQQKIILSSKKNTSKIIIPKTKIIFNILEQFKVIFLELQPLFLYLYIDKSIYYVGIFNIITNIASLIVIYFISKKIKESSFKYYSIVLSLIFILKLNIKSGIFLLVLAFFEGIFIKIYETFSLKKLYNTNNNPPTNYLIKEETIFFTTKSILLLIFILLKLNIYTIMYINIIGIITSGFFFKEKKK